MLRLFVSSHFEMGALVRSRPAPWGRLTPAGNQRILAGFVRASGRALVMALVVGLGLLCMERGVQAATILADSLDGGTSGNKSGGSFTQGGWKAPHQVWWDMGQALTEGSFSVQVTNWNPNDDSDQHHHGKQHIINLYEAPHGSAWDSDYSDPKTSFFNIRTGSSYDNCYKFLSSTAGFEERHESRVKKPHGTIKAENTYTLSVVWTQDGTITSYLNGVEQVTHEHDSAFALRYVFLGTDNTIPGTYGPQHDVVYKNLVVADGGGVTGDGGDVQPDPAPEPEPDPEPENDSGNPLELHPVDDTWADPNAPTVAHGSSDELRVGGDGRTIFLKFNVAGVGPVEGATLRLHALNGGYGGDLRQVGDTSWTEEGLTYQNMPSPDGAVLASLGAVAVNQVVEVDVSDVVNCDGVYSFAIDSAEVDGAGYWSVESSSPAPELILVPGDNPDACADDGEDTSPPPDDIEDPPSAPPSDPAPDPEPDPDPEPENDPGSEGEAEPGFEEADAIGQGGMDAGLGQDSYGLAEAGPAWAPSGEPAGNELDMGATTTPLKRPEQSGCASGGPAGAGWVFSALAGLLMWGLWCRRRPPLLCA